MRKRLLLLGATGSIGKSAQKVAREMSERVQLAGMAAHSNVSELAKAANEFQPDALCLIEESRRDELAASLDYKPRLYCGSEGLEAFSAETEAEMALIAISGAGGLKPALAALESGKDLAIASKEILVMAGAIIMRRARELQRQALPVDSEHNAIFQCMEGKALDEVNRLILTASGGPFRTLEEEAIQRVTPEQALKHPTWKMGKKITIDSATLFNKGLEMIEARWLFDVPMNKIEVVVHPQSIVHSMVEFIDHSILAQLSHSDMCFPIQYAINWPDRIATSLPPLELAKLKELRFEEPRTNVFRALDLAREAGNLDGTMPAVLNAANEVAVERFLNGDIAFPDIWRLVEEVMRRHENRQNPELDEILDADTWARRTAADFLS